MRSRSKPIVVVGSINIDLVANTERIPVAGETVLGNNFQIHPGGKGANQAVAASRLGYPVRLIGRLGSDTFGTQLRTNLEREGVDVAGVTVVQGTSGVAVIVVAQKGENSIVATSGANSQVTPEYLEANIEIIRSAGLVLTQLEIPGEAVEYLAQTCSYEGIPLILDPAPARELPPSLFKHIEWFTPNETEADFFTGSPNTSRNATDPTSIVEMLMSKGVKGVALKMGSRGAYLASAGLREPICPYPVEAIDTTAAGDAFNGAFATGLMLGKGPVESARFACASAAISVTRAGAQSSMPITVEVEQMIAIANAH
ncbi:MAG TPA: ribokinase [Edaphobacter sp.]